MQVIEMRMKAYFQLNLITKYDVKDSHTDIK